MVNTYQILFFWGDFSARLIFGRRTSFEITYDFFIFIFVNLVTTGVKLTYETEVVNSVGMMLMFCGILKKTNARSSTFGFVKLKNQKTCPFPPHENTANKSTE